MGFSNTIKCVLEPLKLEDTLIAQTYHDVMTGNIHGIQTLIKETYQNAYFVHYYAHMQNLALHQQHSARVPLLRSFFADLTTLTTFSAFPKLVGALAEATQRCFPKPARSYIHSQDGMRPPLARHPGFP